MEGGPCFFGMHEKANVNDQNQAASYLMEAALIPGAFHPLSPSFFSLNRQIRDKCLCAYQTQHKPLFLKGLFQTQIGFETFSSLTSLI